MEREKINHQAESQASASPNRGQLAREDKMHSSGHGFWSAPAQGNGLVHSSGLMCTQDDRLVPELVQCKGNPLFLQFLIHSFLHSLPPPCKHNLNLPMVLVH
ncbi:hypothetical protein AAC387_Pa06g1727 [Persea americana]